MLKTRKDYLMALPIIAAIIGMVVAIVMAIKSDPWLSGFIIGFGFFWWWLMTGLEYFAVKRNKERTGHD